MENKSVAKHRDWVFRILLALFALAFLAALAAALFLLAQTVAPQMVRQYEVTSTVDQAFKSIEAASTIDKAFKSIAAASAIQLPPGLQTGPVLAASLLLLLALLLLFVARRRIVRNRTIWQDAGCPNCHEQALARIHRKRRDRLFTWIGIPTARFYCRNCHWSGRRVRKGEKPGSWSTKTTLDLAADYDDGLSLDSGLGPAGDVAEVTPSTDYASPGGQTLAELNEPFVLGKTTPESRSFTSILLEEAHRSKETPPVTDENADENSGDSLPTAEVVAPLGVNLRVDPQAEAELLGTLRSGTIVTVLDNVQQENGITWQYVQAGKQEGWVLNAFLKHKK